ncbi:hypothetical protein A3860_28815 [Niastella vici]|uniref:Secretion system C-terminal sorting domain-containing protein n=2 Tax=Niastella vici TaxID=1703345 RepID=A0A1V9FVI9_9BACT|nr:hypothetical protein A3860_28815 [Niastella vici]
MTPREQGRFCGSCQKTVVDFSMMSDQEVLNYFLKAGHKVCGRFAEDQLNRELPITEKRKRFSWAYVWNVLLATFLLTEANAQVRPKARPKKLVRTIERMPQVMGDVESIRLDPVETVIPVTVKGKVIDSKSNQPVAGASIRIKNTSRGVMADTLGNFKLPVEKKDSLVLEFSAIGYETQTRVIDGLTGWQHVQVFLKPAFANLGEVSVIANENTTKRGYTICNYTFTRSEIIKRNINDWVPTALKKDVKLYPNPVVRGNYIQVSLALKQAGNYKLEVMNTAGQIMLVQPVVMATKEQQVNIYTQSAWSAGIYWVRIISSNSKTVYQSKFILQ